MENNKVWYEEIARAAISEGRNAVISICSKGGFTIAQQFLAKEDGKEMPIFMRGSLHVSDINGLYNLRDSLNFAINVLEGDEDNEWDTDCV